VRIRDRDGAAVVVTASFQRRGAVADASQRSAGQVFTNSSSQTNPGQQTRSNTHQRVIVARHRHRRQGPHIEDLVQSDSHLDEGREQKIDFFSHEQSAAGRDRLSDRHEQPYERDWARYKESTSD